MLTRHYVRLEIRGKITLLIKTYFHEVECYFFYSDKFSQASTEVVCLNPGTYPFGVKQKYKEYVVTVSVNELHI